MEFVRKIVNGEDLKDIIEIPTSLINKRVEIIIIPLEENNKTNKKKKSLSGILSKYADTTLMEKEEKIWYEEAQEW